MLPGGSCGGAPPHVPYRNSALTALLRDSLGGTGPVAVVATSTSVSATRARPAGAPGVNSSSSSLSAQYRAVPSPVVQLSIATDGNWGGAV